MPLNIQDIYDAVDEGTDIFEYVRRKAAGRSAQAMMNPNIKDTLMQSVGSSYPRFKEEMNQAPINALKDYTQRFEENPWGAFSDMTIGSPGGSLGSGGLSRGIKKYFHTTTPETAEEIMRAGFSGKRGEMSGKLAMGEGRKMAEGTFLYADDIDAAKEFGKNFKESAIVEAEINGKILRTKKSQYDLVPELIEAAKSRGYIGIKGEELGQPFYFVFDKSAVKPKGILDLAEESQSPIEQQILIRKSGQMASEGIPKGKREYTEKQTNDFWSKGKSVDEVIDEASLQMYGKKHSDLPPPMPYWTDKQLKEYQKKIAKYR